MIKSKRFSLKKKEVIYNKYGVEIYLIINKIKMSEKMAQNVTNLKPGISSSLI